MRHLSNNDYDQAVRLLRHLSHTKGESLRDKEAARKAGLLVKKLDKKNKLGNNVRRKENNGNEKAERPTQKV